MADLLFRSPLKYEPKTKNRWILRFPSDIGIQTWALKSVNAPKIEFTTVEMAFLNTMTYVNTAYKWNSQSVVVRDFIAPSTSEAVMEWVRLHAESVTGRMGYNIGAAKNIELESLDPTGVATEKWLLVNTIIRGTTDFGDWSYDDAEVREINFDLQPQYCVHLFG